MRAIVGSLLCLAFCYAAATKEDRKVLYGRPAAPRPYKQLLDAKFIKRDSLVSFTVVLKHRNIDKLEQIFREVSDPKHENYGKYLSHTEVLDLIQPEKADRHLVLDWLKAEKDVKIEDRGDAIRVHSSIKTAENLFHTKLFHFFNSNHINPVPIVKFVGNFSIPSSLKHVIVMVTGITEFPPDPLTLKTAKPNGFAKCNTPYTLKKIYNMSSDIKVTRPESTQAPFSRDASRLFTIGFGEKALTEWEKLNNLPLRPVDNILGDAADMYSRAEHTPAGGEALLDVQMMLSFAPNASTSFWVISDWIFDFANQVLNTPEAPLINSMSYGWLETQQCDVASCTSLGFPDSETYIKRTDEEFLSCGVEGYTMLAASGDNGVEPGVGCRKAFLDYPASSPYVTSVGATTVVRSSNNIDIGPDAPPICFTGCNCITSQVENAAMYNNAAGFDTGGGFSRYNERPFWQEAAVSAYLNSSVQFPRSIFWNRENRGYPDVSACGANVAVYDLGRVVQVGGTSASCPIWAGMLTVLNEDRLKLNQPPLGFVNPLLYQMWADNPEAFNDITVGSNGGNPSRDQNCGNLAFRATTGWDAVSGLGTPNFGKIREYIRDMLVF